MKTSVETIDPVKVKLSVEVEAARVKQAFDRAARELAKQVNLPGFRPGKAPRRLIEQRFGEGVVAQQAMEEALTGYYLEALEQEDLIAVSSPEIDLGTFDEREGCTFDATVEVRPEFDPPDHRGIDVTFPEWEVADDDVDAQLAQLRERFAEVEEVDRAAATGDYVTIDLSVVVDGEVLEDATVEDALYEVGSEGVTPLLDEELVGRSAGDSFTYTDTLPEEYPEHGGQEAELTVTVKDVRAKSLPDLDDEFAQTASEFDTIEELRADVRTSLRRRNVAQAQHELRGRILEAFLARVDVPLPPSLIGQERDSRLHRLEHQAEQYGLDVDDLLQAEGLTREEYEERAEEQATGTVKAMLVLDRLAEELEVQVTPQEIEGEVIRHATMSGMKPEDVAQLIQRDGTLGVLVGDVRRRKAIDAIVAAAEVEDAPSDELLQELGLQQPPPAAPADEAEGHEPAGGLIVPGQGSGAPGAGELYVPGR